MKFFRALYAGIFLLFFIQAGVLFAGGKQEPAASGSPELVIYAYDSFVAEWGPGPKVVPDFEKKTGIKVTLVSLGDAGQVLSKAILEKDEPQADIIVGIDNNLLAKALQSGVLSSYKPVGIKNIPAELIFDPSYHVIPFDYGFFSIIYDSQKIQNPPRSLDDLLQERFSKSLILMDPRTSSPGMGFLLWTVSQYGSKYEKYWRELMPSILTITEGWDSGYGLFTSGEAPMVLSYTTSPAYHLEYEKTKRYKATLFKNGNYMQVEGMGITKNAPHRKAAEQFIDFMLTEDFQSVIPLTNWMFPVLRDTPLPDSYSAAPEPEKKIMLDYNTIETNYDKWLDGWVKAVSK